MIKVTLFTNFKSRKGDVNLIDTLDDIRNGKYAPAVNRIRTCMDQGDPETADALKKQLPAITISATYGKQRLKEYMTAYNPLVILDFDGLKHDDLPRLMTLIREACYTVACWISPRGRGIKIIAYPVAGIETVAGNHPALYKLVKDWYERLLGVGADTSGSDAGRLCILSYDPMLYLSPRFVPWLKGEGTLPGDLPVMEAVADKKLSPLISAARRKTTHKYTYTEGNRNNYVHLFACHCNRMGVPRAEVEAYAAKSFNDLPPEELRQAIDSAYTHTEQYATEKTAPRSHRGDGFVFQIQTFLNEHFNLRRNIVKRVAEYRNLKRHGAYKQVIDYWENSVWCALQKAGVFCRLSDLRAVIHSDFSPEYNPFQSYFENLPRWDGKGDPIGDLAATVDTTRPEFWVKCLRKWLVAVVACAINERKANHTVRTGSRRFLCFETLRIDYLSEIDHAAIYAQALALYKQGFRYWFADGDIAEINDNNEPFQQSSPEAELFFTYFRKPTRFEMPLLLSVSEMLAIIAERTRFSVTVMSVNMLGRILKCASFESQKRHGKRLYSVIQLDNDQVEARRKGLGCDPEDEGEDKGEDVDNKDDKSSDERYPSDPKLPF